MIEYLRINENDNVIVALTDLELGQIIKDKDKEFALIDNFKRGHKTSVFDIKEGENIKKYGYSIGHATVDIKKGQCVHTHNITTNLSGSNDYCYNPKSIEIIE